jgi:hypothetical protein
MEANQMAQNLKRNKSLNFRVSEGEKAMIERRMEQTGIKNFRAYLLKMAIDGRVINVEMDSIKECNRLLANVSNNVNQIARRVNETGSIYAPDIADIVAGQNAIKAQQEKIVKLLTAFVKGA